MEKKTWKKAFGRHHCFSLNDPRFNLPLYLSQYALNYFNMEELYRNTVPRFKAEFYENVNVVNILKLHLAENNTTYHITFEAYLPIDKTTQTFETKILFRCRRFTQIVIVYVKIKGQGDPVALETLSIEPIDYFSNSDSDDDCQVSELNPAKSRKTSPVKGPTYLPSTQVKLLRRHPSRFEGDPELRKEIEKFKTDVKNSGGFEVGYYPLMDKARVYGTWICKYYDIENKPISALHLNQLLHLSQLALCIYNMKEEAHFENVKVLRAMSYCDGETSFNITFEASLSNKDPEIFQTNVRTSIALPVEKIKIVFVRIKPN